MLLVGTICPRIGKYAHSLGYLSLPWFVRGGWSLRGHTFFFFFSLMNFLHIIMQRTTVSYHIQQTMSSGFAGSKYFPFAHLSVPFPTSHSGKGRRVVLLPYCAWEKRRQTILQRTTPKRHLNFSVEVKCQKKNRLINRFWRSVCWSCYVGWTYIFHRQWKGIWHWFQTPQEAPKSFRGVGLEILQCLWK